MAGNLEVRPITYPGWNGKDESGGNDASIDDNENSEHVGSDEVSEIFCEPCELDKKKHLAEGYCKNCSEFLCIDCYNNHRRYRPTRHHVLLDRNAMPTVHTVHATKDSCTDHCKDHEDKIIEYYCRSCDIFGCSHCFIVGHRHCSVAPIQDIAAVLETLDEFKLLKDRFEKCRTKLRVHGNKYNSNKSAVDTVHGRAKREIRKQRNIINAFFDKLETQIDKDIDVIRHDDDELMKDIDKEYSKLKSEFQTKLADFKRKEELGQKCQMFVDMKMLGNYLHEFETKMTRMNEENKIRNYELLLSQDIIDVMKNFRQFSVLFEKFSVWKRKPLFERKLNVKAASDRDVCNVTGLCLLNRNHLFVADLNNVCLKLIDLQSPETTNILQIVPTSSWPWDVTKITDKQVAVTLPIVGQILFLSQEASDETFTRRIIDVGRECRGVEYSKGNLIVSFTTDPGVVKILTLNGKVLHTFSKRQDGQELFGRPYYLALGLDHNIVYVSDNKNHSVTSLDRGGTVKDVCKIDGLRGPSGIAVDRTDSLFVCGSRYYNVHQLYSDLSQVQILLDHSNAEEAPQSITCCRTTNRVFIGMQNKNFVNLFQHF